ncbi:MAG: ATP F0F1 synthase subunit B [Aestuariivirga sp.]
MEFFGEAESWVLVSFLLFVCLMIYLKVPKILLRLLDEHSFRVSMQLTEARKLRDEAAAMLADYKKKQADAEQQAADIMASAKADAEQFAIDSRQKMTETLDRRTKQAMQKIAQAEVTATKEVRARATDLAIAAAGNVIAGQKSNPKLIAESIAAVKTKMN